jgi:transposase InsO family protein
VTKWVETKSLPTASEQSVVDFLFNDIFTRFFVPQEIVTDQGTQFTSNLVKVVTKQYQIKHMKSTPYHPQANGQVESTNKIIESILTKIV